jgi:hypothetical protein
MEKIINKIIFITIFLLLSSCRTPNANQTIINATPYGSGVEKVCSAKNINYREKREFPSSGYGPEIELCTKDSYVEFNESKKTMIIVGRNAKGENAGGYFIFENVSKPLNCNLLFCVYGDGKFKYVATGLEEARRYADPELLAVYEKEQEKIRKEEERLAKIRAKEEENRLIAEKSKCSSDINLNRSWKYDDDRYKYKMTYTFKSKTDKPILITAIGLSASGNKIIFEQPMNTYIGPYEVNYSTAYVGNINTEVAEYGFYRCQWATNADRTKSSNIYVPPNDVNSGPKNFLKKIIGQ